MMNRPNLYITCNIKGRLKDDFQTAFHYQKQPVLVKPECRLFADI